MARFFGSVQGSRGQATRLGGVESGLGTDARGWHVGVMVNVMPIEGTDRDEAHITATGGSAATFYQEDIGTVYRDKETGDLALVPSEWVIAQVAKVAAKAVAV